MTTMLAMTDDSGFRLIDTTIPAPAAGEILIKVSHAGVNRADLSQVEGTYPPPPGASHILGLEASGTRMDTGEPVMALLSSGGYAEYAAVPECQVMPVPTGTSLDAAAAIPEALATAWSNLVDVLAVAEGETVLIQGGSGSLGTIAVQLARELGARVIATAGGHERCRQVRALGVECIDHESDIVSRVRDLCPEGVDAVLDIVGSDVGDLLPLMATDGRIAVVARQGGAEATINIGRLMVKRISIHGTTLRSRPIHEKEQILRAAAQFALPRFEDGRIRPIIARRFPLAEARQALDYVRGSRPFGKVVLDC
ncbi:zinc-binding dehydrogenase [Flaviflexus equikiangi]|uniref:Zinc-binding dehydrogenase n=1 Tax=Flaviflexus equikiangi TaxID=2758573 RepID=A0ABS2TC95_9ACTO|nr:zinc-binding dehydrogenase [Flaviflexus equikiangi]MBM9432265.1 zinc-binding dehydrogenase [Flaviflexus equikiangi]